MTDFGICKAEFVYDDDGGFTLSSTEQKRVEQTVKEEIAVTLERLGGKPLLDRSHHIAYLTKALEFTHVSLDASRPWVCFWIVHSLDVLGAEISSEWRSKIIRFIKTCEHPTGGYGGGPGQLAHLAPTYAAVMALVSLRSPEALKTINTESLRKFLLRQKQKNGSFTMHDGGEVDIRGCYCALATLAICGMLTDEFRELCAEWIIRLPFVQMRQYGDVTIYYQGPAFAGGSRTIVRKNGRVICQTYEGGFGGEPGTEAHGGYAYCAVAALAILNRYRLCDTESLLRWLCNRQMRYEGGFQGRTNKLVDGCYSFWQAALFPIIDCEMAREGRLRTDGLFDSRMLEEYILLACQDSRGGLRDKPDKSRDAYHTCYALSGLSVAQSYSSKRLGILGGDANRVNAINPLFNVTTESEAVAVEFFDGKENK